MRFHFRKSHEARRLCEPALRQATLRASMNNLPRVQKTGLASEIRCHKAVKPAAKHSPPGVPASRSAALAALPRRKRTGCCNLCCDANPSECRRVRAKPGQATEPGHDARDPVPPGPDNAERSPSLMNQTATKADAKEAMARLRQPPRRCQHRNAKHSLLTQLGVQLLRRGTEKL